MIKQYEAGDVVKTKWDDSDKPLKAVILRKYRGHRGTKYSVEMVKDGTVETITEDQIVGVVRAR